MSQICLSRRLVNAVVVDEAALAVQLLAHPALNAGAPRKRRQALLGLAVAPRALDAALVRALPLPGTGCSEGRGEGRRFAIFPVPGKFDQFGSFPYPFGSFPQNLQPLEKAIHRHRSVSPSSQRPGEPAQNESAVGLPSLPSDGGTNCLLYTSPSPRDATLSRMPSSA